MVKIFPKDIVDRKPYKQADEVDRYYAGLATKVAKIISDTSDMNSSDVKRYALNITDWFEDIISNIGIWRTFNATCLKRYRSKIPFHDTKEYYDGEPNVCDIAFLLWHYLQIDNFNKRFINPENPFIIRTAEQLCALFDQEYETAPENERLYAFVHQSDVEKEFETMREVVGWLALKSYIGEWNRIAMIDDIEDAMNDDNCEQTDTQTAYQITMNYMFDERTNILAQPMTQWLADIRDTDESHKVLGAMEMLYPEEYLIRDFGRTYLEASCLYDARKYKIALESIDSGIIGKIAVNDTVFNCTLLSYGDLYYQVGVMKVESYAEYRDIIKQTNKAQREKEDVLMSAYKKLMRKSNGTGFLLFANSDDAYRYAREELHLPEVDGEHRKEPVAFVGDEESAHISPHLPAFIKVPNNPYYNQQVAKEKAHGVYVSSTYCNYLVARVLHDNNLLPDAALNSLKGYEYGREFLHKHGRYLIDYCYQENHCAIDDSK